jgi:hypothetical protein
MWRFLFIVFLIAHAFVHLAIWLMPKPRDQAAPFDANHSWLLGDQRTLAVLLAASFGLMVVYFNPWYLFIEGVNAVLIIGLVWLTWPSKTMVGA